jgi:hypothetical protein
MTEKTTPADEYFVNRKEAYDWLVDNGFKVSSGKFYGDCKKGFPAINSDKTVSKYQVAIYGQGLRDDQAPDLSAMQKTGFDHDKAQADAKIAVMKADRMEREEDDLWLHADVAWSVIAGLLGRVRESIRHQLHTDCPEMVVAVAGDVARAPELFELLEACVDKAYNEVAGEKLEVRWEE